MGSETKRYIVLQDPKCSKATVEKSQSFTTPDASLSANAGVEKIKFSESSRLPSVSVSPSEGSDLGAISGGTVDPQFSSRANPGGAYAYRDSKPVKVSGEGLIQTGGTAGTSRYSFIKEGQDQYQLRSTYNQFNRETDGLERSINFEEPTDIYCRPSLLPLDNGNLLCGYLDNRAQPWAWNFGSSLIDNVFTLGIGTGSGSLPSVSVGSSYSIAGTASGTPLTVTGTVVSVDAANSTIDLKVSAGTISVIAIGDVVTIGSFIMNVASDGGSPAGPDLQYFGWKNSVSGSNRTSQTIKLRLQTKEDRYWSTVDSSQSATFYDISVPNIAFLDSSSPTPSADFYVGVTGLSMVQFADTKEVLVLYCGFKGRQFSSLGTPFNPGFLCVDSIDHDLDTLTGFASSNFSPRNRGAFSINQPDQSSSYDGEFLCDIRGVESQRYRPLDMTCQILPSGRVVAVVLYEDSLWSMVSDDRGVSFSGTKIIDLTFGDTSGVLRMGAVDSTLTLDGRIAIIVSCTGLGSRGFTYAEPSSDSNLPESVLSIFVSGDGSSWGREKRLGSGLYMPDYGDVDSNPTAGDYPEAHFDKTYYDQNLYCLSASITLTPEGSYLVTAVGFNQGNPGNAQSQQIYQRVLQVDQLLAGQSGEDVAPTLPPQIFSQSEPYANEYQRLVLAKYQPSVYMDDSINTGTIPDLSSPIVAAYLKNNFVSTTVYPGFLGQLYFSRLPTTGSQGYQQKGGGPFWSQGPIDITTCLWRDSVVTVSCGLAEASPVDYPNSSSDFGLVGLRTADARRETYVEVMYSGGFQPALIRVPNWIRWWARGFSVKGNRSSGKLPNVSASFPVDDLCFQLGSNGWQVSYNAPRNPYDQAWLRSVSGGVESFVHLVGDNRSIFRGLYNNVLTNDSNYYTYAGGLWSVYKDRVVPNSSGSILKSNSDLPSTKYFNQGINPLGFVGRMVLSFPAAAGYVYPADSFSQTNLGARIQLHAGTGSGDPRIEVAVRIGRDLTGKKVGIHLYDEIGNTTLCSLLFDSFDDQLSFNSSNAPVYEIVFCVQPVGSSAYYGKLMARRWDRYADPDWTDDYSYSFSTVPITLGTVGTTSEDIQFGTFASKNGGTQSNWRSFQFSRSFFGLDPSNVDIYKKDSVTNPLPMGMEEFITPALNQSSLPLSEVRDFNGGLFSPSAPSRSSVSTQFLDTGIEAGFAGRSSANDTFSYEAKSSMPTEGIFALPASAGWRSISDTVAFVGGFTRVLTFTTNNFAGLTLGTTFIASGVMSGVILSVDEATSSWVVNSAGAFPASIPVNKKFVANSTNYFFASYGPAASTQPQVHPVPDYELMFDFGEEGVLPEAVAFFGINTDEVVVDFSDDRFMTMSLTGSGSPSLSAFFSSPGGNATMAWNAITGGGVSTTVEVTYKPNYLFYWENYSVNDGSLRSYSNGDLQATLDADASPYIVRFRSPGYDSSIQSIKSNQGLYAPFIPNQFKSQPGENYYLVVYSADLYYDIDAPAIDWSLGNDCKFRHVFKIKDNGSDHLTLTSDIATGFSTDPNTTVRLDKILVGSMTIISDRVGSNLPDFFPDVSKTSASTREFDGLNRYRYMRLRLGGATMHDPEESFLQMGMLIAGPRLSLGSRDIDWGWSYGLEFGNNLYTGLTGQRRSKKNHKPRRDWSISYSPRPSQEVNLELGAGETGYYQYQNPKKGHGKIADSLYPNNTEQMSHISKMSWMEAVQRVLSLEVNGDVVALAFDGDNMVNNHSSETGFPQYGSVRPAASDPSSIVPARLVGYGGATNNAYQIGREIGNQPTAGSRVENSTSCRARPIVTVSELKFSEEL